MGGVNIFHVGYDIELWLVVLCLTVLALAIVLFDRALHHAQHALRRHPKYHDMLAKALGELMVFGLVALVMKIVKVTQTHETEVMVAFQAADMMMFLMAVALIVQSISVFGQLRTKNLEMDEAELHSSEELLRMVRALPHDAQHGLTKQINIKRARDMARDRIIRHAFLKRFGLPQLFPFARYLRRAQDNLVSDMIDIKPTTWLLLVVTIWCLESVSDLTIHLSEGKFKDTYALGISIAFCVFAWVLTLAHVAVFVYFKWVRRQLLSAAVESDLQVEDGMVALLEQVVVEEQRTVGQELASEAIQCMERIYEQAEGDRIDTKHPALEHHDVGWRMAKQATRRLCRRGRTEHASQHQLVQHRLQLRGFQRDPWHFVVISFFALNALYIAFFLMCVAHLTDTAFRLHGMLALMALPLPLLVNLGYFQPRMFRDFILVSGVHQLDTSAMFEVTKRLEQTLDGRTEFVDAVLQYLDEHSLNVDDVKAALADQDPESTGLVSVEGVRVVLSNHGFSMSRFRFNSIVRLLFPVQAAKIEYAVIVHMLSVGQDASTQCSSGSQRRRCNLALPSYESVQTLDLSSSDLDIVQPTLQQQRSLRFVKASRVASAPALVQPTTAQIRRLLTLESM